MLKLAAKTWVAKMAASILNFGTIILLSRNLGAAERGVCGFYVVVIAFSLVFNELAAGSTSIFLRESIQWRQLRKLATVWSFIASGIIAMSLWWLGKYQYTEMLLLWCVSTLNGMVAIQYNILLGLKKYLVYNLLSVLTPFLIMTLVGLVIYFKISGARNYLIIINIAVFIAFVGGYFVLRMANEQQVPALPWREVVTKAFSSGVVNQAGHVVSILNNRFIYYVLPAATLGVFTNALALSEAMLLVPGSLGQIYYAQSAGVGAKDVGSSRSFGKVLLFNSAIMVAAYLVLLIIPAQFYTWLFGPQFSGVKDFLSILGVGSASYSVYLLLSYWQSARGKFEKNLLAGCIGLLVNLAGLAFLYSSSQLNLKSVTYLLSISFVATSIAAFVLYQTSNKRVLEVQTS